MPLITHISASHCPNAHAPMIFITVFLLQLIFRMKLCYQDDETNVAQRLANAVLNIK